MLKKLFVAAVFCVALIVTSCSPKQSEIVVAEYGNYDIKMEEFEKAYAKNVGSEEKAIKDSISDYKKFLELYTNFKMKLRDAKVRNIENDPAIIKELSDYERTIGASYLLEKELFEKGLRDLYEKRSEELRVSHLLIRTDTLTEDQANKKALNIIERVNAGSSFEDEVKQHTDDHFSKAKGGDIYYFTAGMILPEFEDMAYSTPVGEISQTPLKTKYGYHIIKVTDRKKRIPKVKASHILIKTDGPQSQSEEKKKLIESILERARNGEDFAKLAFEYSQDPGSKERNGDLGFFARRQMVQPFDEAVFNLDTNQISDVVETQFGYHIIKLTEKSKYPSFINEKKNLRELFERTRREKDYNSLIEKYSKEVKFTMHDDVFKNIVPNIGDVTFSTDYWESELHKNYGSSVIFSIGEENFNTDSLFSYAIQDPKLSGKPVNNQTFLETNNKFKNDKIVEAKAMNLIEQDSKFAELMHEYKNGILIFRLQEDEVWNKMRMDSIAINSLYNETKENYRFPNRVKYLELFTKNDSLAKVYHSMLENGDNFDSLYFNNNERPVKKNVNIDFVNETANNLSKKAFAIEIESGYSDIIKNKNGWSILKLVEKDPARIKTFEEARAEVTSAYQDVESTELEQSYISKLRKTYKPTLYYEELENVYKK